MNSEVFHILSIIFLISGFIFLTLTIILSVKFELVSMLRASDKIRREKVFSDGDEYFAYVENKKQNSYTMREKPSDSKPLGSLFESEEETSSTVIRRRDDAVEEASATVIRRDNFENSTTVIVSTRKPEIKKDENEFVIVKEIMVISGKPEEVTRRHLSE